MGVNMQSAFVRWWVFFWIIMISVATTLLSGLGAFITAADPTFLSWAIAALFLGASVHWGYKVRHKGVGANTNATDYFIELCTSLGLLGTIIGMIISVVGTFSNLDANNQDSIRKALATMSSGIGTALVTTLVGICCALLLRFQVEIVRMKWSA
jgi:uncharacterized membrane protein YidH (DUF202 family)